MSNCILNIYLYSYRPVDSHSSSKKILFVTDGDNHRDPQLVRHRGHEVLNHNWPTKKLVYLRLRGKWGWSGQKDCRSLRTNTCWQERGRKTVPTESQQYGCLWDPHDDINWHANKDGGNFCKVSSLVRKLQAINGYWKWGNQYSPEQAPV